MSGHESVCSNRRHSAANVVGDGQHEGKGAGRIGRSGTRYCVLHDDGWDRVIGNSALVVVRVRRIPGYGGNL